MQFLVKNCWTLSMVWAGVLVNHPAWKQQTHWKILLKNALKPLTASDNNTSSYTNTDGFLEHSCSMGSPPSTRYFQFWGVPPHISVSDSGLAITLAYFCILVLLFHCMLSLIHPENPHAFINTSTPLTFKVIIDKYLHICYCFLFVAFVLCSYLLTSILFLSFVLFFDSIFSPALAHQLWLLKNIFSGFPKVCNIHSQLIQAHFQITQCHSVIYNKIFLIPSYHPSYQCCYAFYLYINIHWHTLFYCNWLYCASQI